MAVILALLSFRYQGTDNAILAEVEPQRYAISFERAVKVKDIFVIPGQKVKKGDKLIRVERPDLLLDAEETELSLKTLTAELQIKELEKQNLIMELQGEFEIRQAELFAEMKQIRYSMDNSKNLAANLYSIGLLADTVQRIDPPFLEVQLKRFEEEKKSLDRRFHLDTARISRTFAIESDALTSRIDQLKKELELLKKEEEQLIQYAHVDGAIGNIYAEDEELAAPFTTLISVYEDKPSVIRALINEHQRFNAAMGDKVMVESVNRSYKIEGHIQEVGSRIIEYPQRLKSVRSQAPMWGRELFIKIPEENNFLNGEKVFVILSKK